MKTIKALPRIGIRPVIDGRRMGVRESLEEQTMNMAKATAALLSEKLRHPCGTPVECVIADSCIAGMAESAACEEKFSTCHVGLTITITPAGVTGVKPLIWIRCARKRSGALMAPSVRGRYTSQRRWQRITRKDPGVFHLRPRCTGCGRRDHPGRR